MRLDSGPTAAGAGCHGATLTYGTNNDNLSSIVGLITQMQMANNTNTQFIYDDVSTMTTNTLVLR